MEQHQLSVPASLFLSSWFDVQEVAELEAVSQQHLPRAPLLLDLAPGSPGAAPTLEHTASHLLRGRKEQQPFQGKSSALGSELHQSGASTNEQKAPSMAAPSDR